jgi:hypothetical protein
MAKLFEPIGVLGLTCQAADQSICRREATALDSDLVFSSITIGSSLHHHHQHTNISCRTDSTHACELCAYLGHLCGHTERTKGTRQSALYACACARVCGEHVWSSLIRLMGKCVT